MSDSSPPFQFNLLRLAAAMTIFAIPFAFHTSKESTGIPFAIIAGSVLATLVLLAGRKQNLRYINLFAFIVIGGFLGFLLRPELVGGFTRVPQEPDIPVWMITGASLGGVVGLIWNSTTRLR